MASSNSGTRVPMAARSASMPAAISTCRPTCSNSPAPWSPPTVSTACSAICRCSARSCWVARARASSAPISGSPGRYRTPRSPSISSARWRPVSCASSFSSMHRNPRRRLRRSRQRSRRRCNRTVASARPDERVALLAGGEFDRPLRRHVAKPDRLRLGSDRPVVDARAAALDEASRLAVGGGKSAPRDQLEGRDAALEDGARYLDGRQRRAYAALGKDAASSVGGGRRRGAAVAERRRLGRQHLLRLVDLAARQRLEALDLVERQVGEQAQEPPDIGVVGIAPELPVVIGRQAIGAQPHRTLRRLAHLGARGHRDQRRGDAEERAVVDAAGGGGAPDGISPPVRAAQFHLAALLPRPVSAVLRPPPPLISLRGTGGLLAL